MNFSKTSNLTINNFFILFPLHPLMFITIGLIVGIFLQYYVCFFTVFMILPFIVFSVSHPKKRLMIILCGIALLVGAQRLKKQISEHSNFLEVVDTASCDLQGKIIDITFLENSRSKQMITLETKCITVHGLSYEAIKEPKALQLYLLKKQPFIVDDVIEIKNVTLKKPSKDSYQSYLIKENIALTVFLNNEEIVLFERPVHSFRRLLSEIKNSLLDHCEEKLSSQAFSLFSSIFLGNRMRGKKEMENPKNDCKTWGISHYLARSGLHLVIFIFVWHLLLKLLPFSLFFKECILLFMCCLYYLLSWSSISFIRAFLTLIFYKTCTVHYLSINTLHILTIVCFLILLYNPMQLFFLDFQLSFGLTFALAWFNRVQMQKKFSLV